VTYTLLLKVSVDSENEIEEKKYYLTPYSSTFIPGTVRDSVTLALVGCLDGIPVTPSVVPPLITVPLEYLI